MRYPALEIEERVEPFENGRGFSERILRVGEPGRSQGNDPGVFAVTEAHTSSSDVLRKIACFSWKSERTCPRFGVVPMEGVEPTQPYGYQILSLDITRLARRF